MSNFSGKAPRWVSREKAGLDPAYKGQVDHEQNLEKDLDVELELFKSWKKFEAGLYEFWQIGELPTGDEKAFSRLGRPFLVSVATVGSTQQFTDPDSQPGSSGVLGADIFTNWVEDTTVGGYVCKIPYTDEIWGGHRKGWIKGDISSISNGSAFIIPRIKTYNYVGNSLGLLGNSNNLGFEEVYDSAEVNIRTGEITLRADLVDSVYLVVIY